MTLVMGIVNVTPDSFSDGGRYFLPEEAVRRARNMVGEGADIIDFGAESTRPGAEPVSWETEWKRLEPALTGFLDSQSGKKRAVRVSVDTYHPETARRAIAAGADIVNCVYAGPVPEMLDILRESGNAEIIMPVSSRGLAEGDPSFAGRYMLDPMIGFGTTREDDLALLRSVPELAKGARVVVGASRKRIVKKLTGEKMTGKNLGGGLGIAVWCAMNGAYAVRTHDVKETVQALRVVAAIAGGDQPGNGPE